MRKKAYFFSLAGPFWLFFSLFSATLFSQTSWVGSAGGDWSIASNWNNGLPAPGNDALIGGGNSVVISTPLTVNFGVQNFGSIAVTAALSVTSSSFDNSGTITFSGGGSLLNQASFKNFSSMTFVAPATFTNETGANFQNSLATLTIPTTITNRGLITNNGTIDATDATIQNIGAIDNGQIITVKILNIQSGSSYTNQFGSNLNISGAGAALEISSFTTNNGTINNTGLLTVKNNLTSNGLINNTPVGSVLIDAGAQLNVNSGSFLNTSTVTNNGTLTNGNNFFNEGTVTNNAQFNNNNRVENRASATFLNNINATMDNGFGSVLINTGIYSNKKNINFFGLLQNDGAFTNDGTINMNNGSTFDNNLNFTNNVILNTQNTAGNDGTLTNNGALNVLSGSIFTNRATITNTVSGKINNQFEIVNQSSATLTNNGLLTNPVRIFLAGQTINNGYFVNPGDIFVQTGGVLTNNSVLDQQAGNLSNEGSVVNNNTFLNDDCSTIANRAGGSINNLGSLKNRGLIFQRGSLSGSALTNLGGNVHTGATSASSVLCKNPSVTADDNGIVKVYGTGLISFANTDSCQNIIYRANGVARPTFACSDIGTVKQVNVLLRTRLNDSLTCVANVTPVDILAPNFVGCPSDVTIYTPNNMTAATWTAPTAVDNCSIPTVSVDKLPGSNFPIGISAVNYTATDSYGNSQNCQFKINVIKVPAGSGCANDVVGPVFNGCPANQNLTTLSQFANATWLAPTPTDNCQPISLTASHYSGQAFPVGATTIIYSAKDGNNNTGVCQFTVNVTKQDVCIADTQRPNFSNCPTNLVLSPNATTGSAVAIWSSPNVSDNCTVASFSSNFSPGGIFPTGTTVVIYTATDAAGNSATCSFKIIVGNDPCPGDVAGPVFSGCPANIALTTSGIGQVANWAAPTVSDVCGPVSLSSNYASGASFPIGVTQVIYQASDNKGNQSTCAFTVTVSTACSNDLTVPTISGCPVNINVSTTGTAQIATWVTPTATDNCQLVSFTSSYQPGASFPVGTTAVVYTASDLKGNIATCSFNVVVSTPPTGCASNATPAAGATQINPTTVNLSWSAATGATSYDVLLGTANPPQTVIAANVTGTSFAPAGLAYNTTYFWYVRPKNAVGSLTTCSTTATQFRTITPPNCSTLSAPANNATNILPTSVSLSWSAAAGATSYDLYFGTTNPPTSVTAANLTATNFTVNNLVGNTAYYWFVIPKNAAGSATGCASTFKFTTGILPSCSTNSAPANNTTAVPQNVTLTWSAAANATSYDLFLGTTNPPTTLVASNLTTTSFAAANLNLSTTYFWYAKPKNALGAGNCNTSATQFTTGVLPVCATLATPANNATGILSTTNLTWAAISNATNYDVYLGTTFPPTTLVAANLSATSFSATNLLNNTAYYWYVAPKNQFGTNTTCGTAAIKFTTGTPSPTVCKGGSGTGLWRELFYNIGGTDLLSLTSNANYPNNPSTASLYNSALQASNIADNYGERIRGFLTPATSGTYFFTLTGDDNTELYLSTNSNPATKVRIAFIDGWTYLGEFGKYPSQKSVGINLAANTDYFLELLHKEGGGGDHWGIYWSNSNVGTPTVLPLSTLSPISTNCNPVQSCAGNLLTNGSFENDFNSGWQNNGVITTTPANVNSGQKAGQVCNADGGFGLNVPAIVGATYTFKCTAKISGAPTCAGVGFQFFDAAWNIISSTDRWQNITSTSFSQFTFTGVAPANAAYVQGYVWKCGVTGCLFADDFCLTVSTPSCNKTALFVVGNTTLNSGDQAVFNRLQALGMAVTTRTDAVSTTADANGKGLIVISSTTLSGNVNTKFTNVAVPIINYEAYLFDDLKMTGGVAETDYGGTDEYRVNMLAPQHPIAGGLSGFQNVFGATQFLEWGTPGSGAVRIAELPNLPNKEAIFAYETGSTMVGMNAPARRVGFFLHDVSPTSLTAAGLKLFDNAVKWATNCGSLNNLGYVASNDALTFDAFPKYSEIELKWISRTGETNDFFQIEKSIDGQNWQFIGDKIDARGTKNDNQYFQDFDKNPVSGINQYRLKLTHLDGSVSYSEIQMVDFQPLVAFEVFPNPTRNHVFVNLRAVEGESVKLRLFDQRGVQMQDWDISQAPADPLELNLDGRANGQYILWIYTQNYRPEARKIVLTRE